MLRCLPTSRLPYAAEAAYCRSRYLLRNVERPARTDEKQHWARIRIRKRGLSKRSTNFLGKPDQKQITSDYYTGTTDPFLDTKPSKAMSRLNITHSLFRKPSRESSSSESDSP